MRSLRSKRNRPRSVITAAVVFGFLAAVFSAEASIPGNSLDPAYRSPGEFLPRDPERLVVRVQALLRELGLYQGTIGGVPTPETENAVRSFQRIAGLPEDGRIGTELLEQLEKLTPPRALRRRLDEIRRKGKEAARLALNLSPIHQGIVGSGTALAPRRTGDWDDCRRRPDTPCLLAESVATASTAGREELRDWAYGEIAAVQAKAGFLPEALATLRAIDDPRMIITGLREVAKALALSGRTRDAFHIAAVIPEPFHCAEALLSIGSARATGEVDRTFALSEIAALIEDVRQPEQRLTILLDAAKLGAGMGHQEEVQRFLASAEETVDFLGGEAQRSAAIGRLAASLVEVNRPERAQQLLAKHPGEAAADTVLPALAVHKASLGDVAAAVASVRQIREERVRASAFQEISRVVARKGHRSEARRILAQAVTEARAVRHPYARDVAVSRAVLLALEVSGNADPALLAEAEAMARSAGNPHLRAASLWSVAFAMGPDQTAAARLADEAEKASRLIEDELGRTWLTAEVSERHGRMGQCDQARRIFGEGLTLADGIETKWLRARAMARLAEALNVLANGERRCWP